MTTYSQEEFLKKSILNLLVFALVLITSFVAKAQPGAIDLTFNSTDGGFNYAGLDNTVRTSSLQPDGKIVIGGEFTSFDGTSVNRVARLNADGTLDESFDPGTGANDVVQSVAVQSNGKIIIAGNFTEFNGSPMNHLARLNVDGSLDDSFDPGNGTSGIIYSIAVQPDGKIIIGGTFISYNDESIYDIARLHADGSLDDSFDSGSGVNGLIYDSTVQSDGKIIIGGLFTEYNEWSRNRIARLNPDGSIDALFNTEMGANDDVHTISTQPNGKIVVGGEFTSLNGTPRNRIARLNTDGTIDTSFDPDTGPSNTVFTTSVQPDGKIIIGGDFDSFSSNPVNRIARLDSDGTLDEGFDMGDGANGIVYTSFIQPDGRIVFGGEFTDYSEIPRYHIVRVTSNGNIDTSFNPDTGASNTVYATAIQSDGKIIIGGEFASFNGIPRNRIARVNPDGSIDEMFDPGSGANNEVHAIAIQQDGKIIIGGKFTSFNNTTINRIVRLNVDGSIDNTFDPGVGVDGVGFNLNTTIHTISIQSDGKILVGGRFNEYNGESRNCIVRLNSDGSLDNTFDPGEGATNPSEYYEAILTSAIRPDGKILIGGYFEVFDGLDRDSFVQLNSDGSVDPTFFPGSGAVLSVFTPGHIYSINLLENGKIIIGGDFERVNGENSPGIGRLNANGTLDESFDVGEGTSNFVFSTSVQTNGKIIVAGGLSYFNDVPRNKIARLNTDGSLDETFDSEVGANNPIHCTAFQPDGKIIIGGDFTSYDGIGRNRLARVLSICNPTSGTDSVTACDSYTWIDGENYTSNNDTATHVLVNSVGCDSIVTLNLTINNSTSDTTDFVTCDDYTWPASGETYTETGTYTAVTTNEVGCDHTEVLNLINNSTSTVSEGSACESFTWSENGETYTESGVYVETSMNDDNCTHTDTLNLTINSPTSNSTDVSACDNYTWSINGETYASSGEFIEVSTNENGCTHTDTLNLTIDNSTTNTTTETACNSYTWSVNGETYYEDGTYVSEDGCHTEELILSINSVNASISLNGITLSTTSSSDYQWLDCDNDNAPIPGETNQTFTPSSSGNYAVSVTQNNCSSTSACVFVDVTIGISEEQNEDFLVAYPNPGEGVLFIETSFLGRFSVINALGQTLTTFKLDGRDKQTINLQHLESGVYFLVSERHPEARTKIILNR